VVLGGAGIVGSWTARGLLMSDVFDEVILADINAARAKEVAEKLGGNVSYREVNAESPESIKEAVKDVDIVVNCVGPFYRYGPPILETAIKAGKNYVDICDDYDATLKMLELDSMAKEAGVSALIGMGSSPGAANVFVKFCAEQIMEEAHSVDIYHAHGGDPEGPGVIKHRIHSMLIDIPVFDNGQLKTVKFLEESGRALIQEVEFPEIGKCKVYPYPHPETITLPRYIKGLKWVMNRGVVLPEEYFELIIKIVSLGMIEEEPIEVAGQKIAPIDFVASYVLKRREELLKKAGITEPIGALKIVIGGVEKGKKVQYVAEAVSRGGMMEGTAIPAAIGAILMAQGKIEMKGVFPPEAAVNPMDVFEWAGKFRKGGASIGVKVKKVDEEGRVKEIPLPI